MKSQSQWYVNESVEDIITLDRILDWEQLDVIILTLQIWLMF